MHCTKQTIYMKKPERYTKTNTISMYKKHFLATMLLTHSNKTNSLSLMQNFTVYSNNENNHKSSTIFSFSRIGTQISSNGVFIGLLCMYL